MGFYCFVDVADFLLSLFPHSFFNLHATWSFLSFVVRVFSRSYIRTRRVPRVLWRVYPGKFQHPTRLPLIPGGHDSHAMMIEMNPFPFLAFLFFHIHILYLGCAKYTLVDTFISHTLSDTSTYSNNELDLSSHCNIDYIVGEMMTAARNMYVQYCIGKR